MHWLPNPVDFRQSLKSALEAGETGVRLEKLAAIAQLRLGLVETIQVDNALKAIAREGDAGIAAGFPRVGLAVLASSTIDHLLPAIRVGGLRRRLLVDTYAGSFGQYRQELMDPASELQAFKPEMILLSLVSHETIAGVPLTASAEEARAAVAATIDDLRVLWRKARENLGATVIQQTFLDVTETLFGSYDQMVPGAPARVVSDLNAQLAVAAAQEGILLLDVTRSSARDGIDAWFDVARWLQGKIEIAPRAAPIYGDLVARLIGARRGQSKKCLVLDLDDTLWGGVIGDVGLEGIVLGEGSAAGEAHLALQRYAKALKSRGIILAVCSKNEAAIAEAAFREHPEMLLKRADISAFIVNWTDKAQNLRAIAEQLNIGLDSLVFVDDNPAERARVRASLPMVAVPELPDDPAHYVRSIADAGYFEAVTFTIEDRQRVEQYAANAERESLRGSLESMDDFLRGLDMSLVFGPVTAVELARATQLINKTNQFNTTTRRYTAEELSALTGDPENITLQFRLIDRFGDNGIVSVLILCRDEQDPGLFELVSWVMSCRVFGRQLEYEAMNIAVESARGRGARTLHADFIATARNAVIKDLFSKLGFVRRPEPAPEGTTRWAVDLADYAIQPTYIRRGAPT
jgi:FkbH-like protein